VKAHKVCYLMDIVDEGLLVSVYGGMNKLVSLWWLVNTVEILDSRYCCCEVCA